MKNLTLYLLSLLVTSFCYSQESGSIKTKESVPKSGSENHYIYTPPKGLIIPANVHASVVYFNKVYKNKTIPLTNVNNHYEFAFTAPDSTDVLIIGILGDENSIIDNNKNLGYASYLYTSKGKLFPSAKLTQALLLTGYTAYYHKLKVPDPTIIILYEEAYRLTPSLRKEPSYGGYLRILYKEKGNAVKPLLLQYASHMLSIKGSETSLLSAMDIYNLLNEENAEKNTKEKILIAFPHGQLAQQNFWRDIYLVEKPSDESVLKAINTFQERFNDGSINYYGGLMNLYVKAKDWDNVLKYGTLITDKLQLASFYNNIAWNLVGGGLEGPGNDLQFAKTISKITVDIVDEKMKHPAKDDDADELVGAYIGYTDTYALILYKLGNFDSAFYYQDAILARGPMGIEGMERYGAYAEKTKGAVFTKEFIEPQLLKGINSPTMEQQLQRIYAKLNLPEAEFTRIKQKFTSAAKKKAIEKIIKTYGSQKGPEFTLKDLEGKSVSLSSLKNKVIVIDFWATWCGPCRASFPGMQKLVEKYKGDPQVAFVFVDSWEHKLPKVMVENASNLIKDNNYDFHILLDEKDKVITDYKVEGIPSKFIIDKKGNIAFMQLGGEELSSSMIESAKEN